MRAARTRTSWKPGASLPAEGRWFAGTADAPVALAGLTRCGYALWAPHAGRPMKTSSLFQSLLMATLGILAGACTRNAADPAMMARLQHLEDREQILELMAAYGATLDRRDFAAFGKLFAEDAEYGSGPGAARGREAIQAQLERIIGSNPSNLPAPNFHLFFNPSIHIEGDTASATSLGAYTAPDAASSSTRMVFFVSYADTLVKQEGRWVFQRRVTGAGPPPAPAR